MKKLSFIGIILFFNCSTEPGVKDCAGVVNGLAIIDECNVCGGGGADLTCLDGTVVCNESDCSAYPPNYPNWQDNPGGYEFAATIVGGLVLNDGVQMGDTGDMFAAFDVGGNIRGLGTDELGLLYPTFGQYGGTPVWELTLRSNAEGDILSFKYYDASEDAVLDISETYTFVINDQVGNMTDPITFNAGDEYFGFSKRLNNDIGVKMAAITEKIKNDSEDDVFIDI